MYRCLSVIVPVPSKKTNVLIVFGGNPLVYGTGEHAIALDLKTTESGVSDKIYAKDFGDDIFRREIFVGNEYPISRQTNNGSGVNNIVDLQGVRAENFSEWLCITSEEGGGRIKQQQFGLTSQETDFGYRWRF